MTIVGPDHTGESKAAAHFCEVHPQIPNNKNKLCELDQFLNYFVCFSWSMHWLVCAGVADAPRLPSAAHLFVLSALSGSQFQFLPSVMAQRRHKLATALTQGILFLRRLCLTLLPVSLTGNFRPLVFTAKNRKFHYVLLIRAIKVNNNIFPCFHVFILFTVFGIFITSPNLKMIYGVSNTQKLLIQSNKMQHWKCSKNALTWG